MNRKFQDIAEFALYLGILVWVQMIATHFFFRIDLTEDKRYSVSPVAKEMLSNLEGKVEITVYLEGNLPSSYQLLRETIEENVMAMQAYAPSGLTLRFVNPSAEPDERLRQQGYGLLDRRGIKPKYILNEREGVKEELFLFPGATIAYLDREASVNFIQSNPMVAEDQQIQSGIESIEYELLRGIRRLSNKEYKRIGFVEGHGEWTTRQTADIRQSLSEQYIVDQIRLSDSIPLNDFAALIVAGSRTRFSESEKLVLDQYIVKGGRALFCIDPLDVRVDSLTNGETYGLINPLNLEDLFFAYGLRMNPTLIQDLNCANMRVATGLSGENQELPFPYLPVVYQFGNHVIGKNLNYVVARFISTLDTVKAEGIRKTPLFFSSTHARTVNAPLQIDLDVLKREATEERFNLSSIPMAYLLEGSFKSLYAGRPLPAANAAFQEKSKEGKVIVIGDADFIRNDLIPGSDQVIPLGRIKDNPVVFANKEFILNAMDYLTDGALINVKGKEIQLRPIDSFKVRREKIFWQSLNLFLPLMLIMAYGTFRMILRKRKNESYLKHD